MPISTKVKTKSCCERVYRASTASSSSERKSTKIVVQKKTPVKKDGKCSSAGIITKPPVAKPKKTTKSDLCFLNKPRPLIDYCKKCGDAVDSTTNKEITNVVRHIGDTCTIPLLQLYSGKGSDSSSYRNSAKEPVEKQKDSKPDKHSNKKTTMESDKIPAFIRNKSNKSMASKSGKLGKASSKASRNSVQEYYMNENFRRSSDSIQDISKHLKKPFLDTITELPEVSTVIEKEDSDLESQIFEIFTDSDEDEVTIDPDDYESLRKLRDFRDDNYFECHSAKTRVESKESATSLIDHKCVYRFYLNDRLFPEPLSTDHQKNIRCTECHLPLDLRGANPRSGPKDINGTIQAKVKLGYGDKAQDMVLMLPVKEPLIIPEKRKERQKEEKEIMYFGVIKLDSYGNSIFNQTLPTDSLALKYQKGYKEFVSGSEDFKYEKVNECDVIVI